MLAVVADFGHSAPEPARHQVRLARAPGPGDRGATITEIREPENAVDARVPAAPAPASRSVLAVAIACAALAVFAGLVSVLPLLGANEGRVSALVRMGSNEALVPVARSHDPDFAFVHPDAHYDGVYYYAIALDPFARGEPSEAIDFAAYRYGHPGYAWLARLVSFGRPQAVPAALLATGFAGLAVAAAAASYLSVALGRSPWGGLVIALSPGLMQALTSLTAEPVAAALVALVLLAWLRRRLVAVALLAVALALVKEQFVLVPVGLAMWEIGQWVRDRGPLVPQLLALAAAPVAWVAWQLWLRGQFGVWSFVQSPQHLSSPIVGWWDSLRAGAERALLAGDTMQVGSASVPLLAVVGVGWLVALVVAARVRTPLDPVLLLQLVILASVNPVVLLYPKDLLRATAVLLPLAIAVVAARPVDRDPAVSSDSA
jgi:hypothetical protein